MAIQHLFYRMYHLGLRLAAMLLPIPEPHVFHGDKAIEQWLAHLEAQKCKRILLVSDPGVLALNLHAQLKEQLLANHIEVVTFSDLSANPSIEQIEQGVRCYQANKCDTLLAIGGGSAMDCAKLIAARIARPKKSLRQMRGLFKVLRTLPPVYVVPTTAGTGSEVTVAAVVSDTERRIKFAVNDLCLMPKGVLFLPELTTGLPPGLTASTGIDALTHALEAYIGINATAYTRDKSEKAVALILDALPRAYHHPDDLAARTDMLWAAMFAGQAFTRTSVGYVHAIAHQLGAVYGLGHGLANALVLRPILDFYGDRIDAQMKRLAKHSLSEHSTAAELRDKIYALLDELAIPHCIADLKAEDIPLIAKLALEEAHPDYPVPCFMTQQELEDLLRSLLPNNEPDS
ncbi:iron-containing alcohol dehydrogenase [Pseudoalteromonas sp. T1lg75]|uniref:iron-containing alcohol dehydrogenase n=1 Tax=Pseudoalteromonas sp. T1lg75 TaxID=2077102 RepID=UPI000CF62A55|nr:iron-containing alcohol dehydrogenase [Pseudoalteromonas sp. T1lg75]